MTRVSIRCSRRRRGGIRPWRACGTRVVGRALRRRAGRPLRAVTGSEATPTIATIRWQPRAKELAACRRMSTRAWSIRIKSRATRARPRPTSTWPSSSAFASRPTCGASSIQVATLGSLDCSSHDLSECMLIASSIQVATLALPTPAVPVARACKCLPRRALSSPHRWLRSRRYRRPRMGQGPDETVLRRPRVPAPWSCARMQVLTTAPFPTGTAPTTCSRLMGLMGLMGLSPQAFPHRFHGPLMAGGALMVMVLSRRWR